MIKIPTKLLVGLAAFALGLLALTVAVFLTLPRPQAPSQVAIGGPFRLTTQENETFSSDTLKGSPYLVFFGFTHCPEVCPTTLFDLSQNLAALGKDADRLKVLFITVDPARDTPDLMRTYLASFEPRIIGLTGSEEEIAAVAKAYRVYYRKVPTNDGYTMDHTATVYLMGRDGGFVGTLDFHEPRETQLAKLTRLARQG
jgi:protein SCO1/2